MAKDTNTNELPNTMYQHGTQIEKEVLAKKFACFFDKKIRDLLEDVTINEDVYNGTLKVQP